MSAKMSAKMAKKHQTQTTTHWEKATNCRYWISSIWRTKELILLLFPTQNPKFILGYHMSINCSFP